MSDTNVIFPFYLVARWLIINGSISLQTASNRSHYTIYNPISTNDSPDGKSSAKLLITVSNWHFNERAQKLEKDIRCTTKDCKVSIKLSSDTFAKNDKVRRQQEYHFDKNGLCVDYLSFLSLVQDCLSNNSDFWDTLVKSYNQSSKIPLPGTPAADKTGGKRSASATPSNNRRRRIDSDNDDNEDDGGDNAAAAARAEEVTDGPSKRSGRR